MLIEQRDLPKGKGGHFVYSTALDLTDAKYNDMFKEAIQRSWLCALDNHIIMYGTHVFKYCGELKDVLKDKMADDYNDIDLLI